MKAIIPGSFNPITNGHLSLIRKASKIFDEVIVLVCTNTDKPLTAQLTNDDCKDLTKYFKEEANIPNARAERTTSLVTDYALGEFTAIVRGIRDNNDYNYEENLAKIYTELNPQIEVVWLRPDPTVAFVSSSLVREMIKHKKWTQVKKYVPHFVYKELMLKWMSS